MSTDKQAVEDATEAPAADAPSESTKATESTEPAEPVEERRPSWWHRDHPTFAALSGFFTGLVFVALVPAIYVGILSLMFDNDRVEELFPFVLVTLVVPLGLVVNQRTRRFGTYFWVGMLLTAVVVVGVGALVLWFLVEHQN
jgi:hypothetical protein